mgnify:CR=1 FL=1
MSKLAKGDMVEFSGYLEKKIDEFRAKFVLDSHRKTGIIVECNSTTVVILSEDELFKIDTVNPMTLINKLNS